MNKLLPCPFCGNEYPWQYIGAFTAVLRCECGAEIDGAAVRTVYQKHELPPELEPLASPAELLTVRTKDGDKGWPEHGYYSVSVIDSFHHFGHAQKWNRRTEVMA